MGRADAFLDQFQTDLDSALRTLRATTASADPKATQRAAHSLIALAGTVGASELEDAARRLNTVLQSSDTSGRADLVVLVGTLTARLMTELDDWRRPGGKVPKGPAQ
jgi:HPt (histidine-containing phosphotransfer) domain-containing protein